MGRPRVLTGIALHADLDFLETAAPLVEEAEFFEINPETLWRPRGGRLERNGFHDLYLELKERSGRPFVAHGLAFSLGTPLEDEGEPERIAAWRERLADLHAEFGFLWLSEHLGFTCAGGRHAVLPLPLPYTREAAAAVAARLRILKSVVPEVAFETPANAMAFGPPEAEAAFFETIAAETPCGIVLDLHNLWTGSLNLGFDPAAVLDRLDLGRVLQIHLSGGSESEAAWLPSGRVFRLDSHDGPVPEPVWELYERALPACTGLRGVVVERLNGTFGPEDVPGLVAELRRARAAVATLAGTAPGPARTDATAGLPAGSGLAATERALMDAVYGDSAPSVPAALSGLDPDGLAITRLIVQKLRFERICRGDRDLEAWFDRDPAGFVAMYRAYDREVPPRAYFPEDEARTFDRWCEKRGIVNPAGTPRV